jgi:Xaa-Pro aminopeptidase
MPRPVPEAPPGLSPQDLDRFREVQRLAYACAEAIASELAPGDTERQVARRMKRWLEARGVDDWFHLPFAWFGDRTAFRGVSLPHQFFPTDRALEVGMPSILDVAPVVDGYAADIGYPGAMGAHAGVERLKADLAEHRALILKQVRAGRSLLAVYRDVDALMAAQGYDNRHRCYPFGVLAHRVERVEGFGKGLEFAGFGLRGIGAMMRSLSAGRVGGWSPLWGPHAASDHAPTPGLWAVEPHVGLRGVGAKFEELLVVTESDAFWLDDAVPQAAWGAAG